MPAKQQTNEIDIRVNEGKTLAEYNTNRLEQIEEESKITNLRLEEYSRKTEQLEELVDDQVNRNARSTLIIRGVKFNLHNEKSWNDTEYILATTLCIQFGWNKNQFAHDIERPLQESTRIQIPQFMLSFYLGKLDRAY